MNGVYIIVNTVDIKHPRVSAHSINSNNNNRVESVQTCLILTKIAYKKTSYRINLFLRKRGSGYSPSTRFGKFNFDYYPRGRRFVRERKRAH